jgi:hypothetical protein
LTGIAVLKIGLKSRQFRPLEAALHSIVMAPFNAIVSTFVNVITTRQATLSIFSSRKSTVLAAWHDQTERANL